jgi:hypothetical protein
MAASDKSALSILSGPLAGASFPLSDPTGEVMVGSDPSCGVHLPLPRVASVHARISFDEGGAFVQSMGEDSPVYVNDDRVAGRTPLRSGDILWLGAPGDAEAVMIQCRLAPPEAAPSVAAAAAEDVLAETMEVPDDVAAAFAETTEPSRSEPPAAPAPAETAAPEPESFWFEEPPPPEPPRPPAASEEAFVVDEAEVAPPSFEPPAAAAAPAEIVEEEPAPLAPEASGPEAFFAPEPEPEPIPTFEEEGAAPFVVPEPAAAEPLAETVADVPLPPAVTEDFDEAALAEPPPLPVVPPSPPPVEAAPPKPVPAAAPPAPVAPAKAAAAAPAPPPASRAARAPTERPAAEEPPAEKPPVRKAPPATAARPTPRPRPPVARPPARAGGPPVAAIAVGALVVLAAGGFFAMRALRPAPSPSPPAPVVAAVPPSTVAEPPVVAATVEPPREVAPIATAAPTVREETVPVTPVTPPPVAAATIRPPASSPPSFQRGASPVPVRPVPSVPAGRASPPPAPVAPAPAAQAAPFVTKADAAVNARNYDEAIGLYDEALKLDPQNAKAAAGKKGALAWKEAGRHTFTAGRTTVQTGKEKGGLAGFDTSGVNVKGQTADFAGRLELVMEPAVVRPGDGYGVKIYVVNEGKKNLKPSGISYTTSVNGKPTPGTLPPQAKDIAPQQRTLVQEVKGVWPEGVTAWSTEVTVNAGKGESLRTRLTWK